MSVDHTYSSHHLKHPTQGGVLDFPASVGSAGFLWFDVGPHATCALGKLKKTAGAPEMSTGISGSLDEGVAKNPDEGIT
jgi:hypothetical protein